MPISVPTHIFEPDSLQCGQTVLAMISGKTVDEIISLVNTERETTLKQMKDAFAALKITVMWQRKEAFNLSDLPDIALLSLETPHCWHWSLYYKGRFYDPEYGLLDEFPPSNRKYYWEIKE